MKPTSISGRWFDWSKKTYIMGILNRTPDSFSDGGKFTEFDSALRHAQLMVSEGADFIDIGGESTRPGFVPLSPEEEMRRVIPVIEELKKTSAVPISIDTYHAKTAAAAVQAGAGLINDIWGLKGDPEMAAAAASLGVPVCIMHNRKAPDYANLIEDMKRDLEESLVLAAKSGISEENIILDPGIGFGKTYEHNLGVMRNLDAFLSFGYPLLLGVSRKSMVGLTLNLPVEERLEGTIAANVAGILKGADILRVHDVRANLRAAAMADRLVRFE